MNYNSWTFWILFALVIVRYWRLSHRHQNDLLLVASYFFYGFSDCRFLFLVLISTNIDYIDGLGVALIRLTTDRIRRPRDTRCRWRQSCRTCGVQGS